MHSYLQAIGFRRIKKTSQLNKLFESVTASPDNVKTIPVDDETTYTVISKEVADGVGLSICGELNQHNEFQMEYYYPYLLGNTVSTNEECDIKREIEKEAYNGICDDVRLGMNLIFFINNFADYVKYHDIMGEWPVTREICLSALSVSGKILLPVYKTKNQLEIAKRNDCDSIKLIEAARNGDTSAMESLTVKDMNTYTQVTRHLKHQDLYSIVETSFMPSGVECDQYSILAYINSCSLSINSLSGEEIYVMEVICNNIPLRLVINKEDLLGVPKPGFRFKGDIWLQGKGNWKNLLSVNL